jgi:hypothetical protein
MFRVIDFALETEKVRITATQDLFSKPLVARNILT